MYLETASYLKTEWKLFYHYDQLLHYNRLTTPYVFTNT